MFEINELGVITQDTSVLKSAVEEAYKKALGDTLNTEAGTPQGQLIINDTALLTEAQAQLLYIVNSITVFTATGQELDALASIFGYYRKKNVATVVTGDITGVNGTVIPQGSQVSDGTYIYDLQETVIISGGVATGTFQCETPGAIPCLAGTLTNIITTIAGWNSINNNTNGILGYDSETDNVFRQRITANYLNIRAIGLMGAIIDEVAQVDNVLSVVGNENYTDTTQVIDGISMAPHSIYLTVLGGKDEDIAFAIYKKKTNGTGVNGNTIVSYIDTNSNRKFSYYIFRPTTVSVYLEVNYSANAFTTSQTPSTIQNLITEYFTLNPFNIGQTISSGLIYTALDTFTQGDILSIKVSLDGMIWNDYQTLTNQEIASIDTITVNEI